MTSDARDLVNNIEMVVLDFDGVLTNNKVIVMEDGTEAVICSRSDGFGLERIKELGIHLFVLSKEKNPIVSARCKKLNIPCIQGCDDKAVRLRKEIESLGLALQQVAYIGNDINDIPCLQIVGLPVCVADAHPEARRLAKIVTSKKGGEGAVREFCDIVASNRRTDPIIV